MKPEIKVTRKSAPPAEAEVRDFMTSDPEPRPAPPALIEPPAPPALAEVDVEALVAEAEAGGEALGLPATYTWGDRPGELLAGQLAGWGFAERVDEDTGEVTAPLVLVLRDANAGGAQVACYCGAALERRFLPWLGLEVLTDKAERVASELNALTDRQRAARVGTLLAIVYRGLGAAKKGRSAPRLFDVMTFGRHKPIAAADLLRWRAAVAKSLGGAPAAAAKVADSDIPF